MNARVLVIEDERDLGELIRMYLGKEGIDTEIVETGEEALRRLDQSSFDLILLDLNLPGMDGYEFLQTCRQKEEIPVIIVSARTADEDIIMGLGIGADEFVTKPFAPRVLSAKVRAHLRRARSSARKLIRFGPFELDVDGYSLKRNGERVPLSSREFDVLQYLALHPGRAILTDDLYAEVWQQEYGDSTSIAVYVRRIRKKIEDDPQNPVYIQTIHGKGYRFNGDTIQPGTGV